MKKLPKELVKQLEDIIVRAAELQEAVQEARDQTDEYLDGRSDKWKEEHEGDYEDFQGELDQILDALTNVAELSADVSYQG